MSTAAWILPLLLLSALSATAQTPPPVYDPIADAFLGISDSRGQVDPSRIHGHGIANEAERTVCAGYPPSSAGVIVLLTSSGLGKEALFGAAGAWRTPVADDPGAEPAPFAAHYYVSRTGRIYRLLDESENPRFDNGFADLLSPHSVVIMHDLGPDAGEGAPSDAWNLPGDFAQRKWRDRPRMVNASANLVAFLCAKYNAPMKWLSPFPRTSPYAPGNNDTGYGRDATTAYTALEAVHFMIGNPLLPEEAPGLINGGITGLGTFNIFRTSDNTDGRYARYYYGPDGSPIGANPAGAFPELKYMGKVWGYDWFEAWARDFGSHKAGMGIYAHVGVKLPKPILVPGGTPPIQLRTTIEASGVGRGDILFFGGRYEVAHAEFLAQVDLKRVITGGQVTKDRQYRIEGFLKLGIGRLSVKFPLKEPEAGNASHSDDPPTEAVPLSWKWPDESKDKALYDRLNAATDKVKRWPLFEHPPIPIPIGPVVIVLRIEAGASAGIGIQWGMGAFATVTAASPYANAGAETHLLGYAGAGAYVQVSGGLSLWIFEVGITLRGEFLNTQVRLGPRLEFRLPMPLGPGQTEPERTKSFRMSMQSSIVVRPLTITLSVYIEINLWIFSWRWEVTLFEYSIPPIVWDLNRGRESSEDEVRRAERDELGVALFPARLLTPNGDSYPYPKYPETFEWLCPTMDDGIPPSAKPGFVSGWTSTLRFRERDATGDYQPIPGVPDVDITGLMTNPDRTHVYRHTAAIKRFGRDIVWGVQSVLDYNEFDEETGLTSPKRLIALSWAPYTLVPPPLNAADVSDPNVSGPGQFRLSWTNYAPGETYEVVRTQRSSGQTTTFGGLTGGEWTDTDTLAWDEQYTYGVRTARQVTVDVYVLKTDGSGQYEHQTKMVWVYGRFSEVNVFTRPDKPKNLQFFYPGDDVVHLYWNAGIRYSSWKKLYKCKHPSTLDGRDCTAYSCKFASGDDHHRIKLQSARSGLVALSNPNNGLGTWFAGGWKGSNPESDRCRDTDFISTWMLQNDSYATSWAQGTAGSLIPDDSADSNDIEFTNLAGVSLYRPGPHGWAPTAFMTGRFPNTAYSIDVGVLAVSGGAYGFQEHSEWSTYKLPTTAYYPGGWGGQVVTGLLWPKSGSEVVPQAMLLAGGREDFLNAPPAVDRPLAFGRLDFSGNCQHKFTSRCTHTSACNHSSTCGHPSPCDHRGTQLYPLGKLFASTRTLTTADAAIATFYQRTPPYDVSQCLIEGSYALITGGYVRDTSAPDEQRPSTTVTGVYIPNLETVDSAVLDNPDFTFATDFWNSVTETRTPPPMSLPRAEHTAHAFTSRKASGHWTGSYVSRPALEKFGVMDKVIVIGGCPDDSRVEVYDFASNTWVPGPRLLQNRKGHRSLLLNDGRILIAGGVALPGGSIEPGVSLQSCEIYDPYINTLGGGAIYWASFLPAPTTRHALATGYSFYPVLAGGSGASDGSNPSDQVLAYSEHPFYVRRSVTEPGQTTQSDPDGTVPNFFGMSLADDIGGFDDGSLISYTVKTLGELGRWSAYSEPLTMIKGLRGPTEIAVVSGSVTPNSMRIVVTQDQAPSPALTGAGTVSYVLERISVDSDIRSSTDSEGNIVISSGGNVSLFRGSGIDSDAMLGAFNRPGADEAALIPVTNRTAEIPISSLAEGTTYTFRLWTRFKPTASATYYYCAPAVVMASTRPAPPAIVQHSLFTSADGAKSVAVRWVDGSAHESGFAVSVNNATRAETGPTVGLVAGSGEASGDTPTALIRNFTAAVTELSVRSFKKFAQPIADALETTTSEGKKEWRLYSTPTPGTSISNDLWELSLRWENISGTSGNSWRIMGVAGPTAPGELFSVLSATDLALWTLPRSALRPPGPILSQFFEFNPHFNGYHVASELRPGRGYWVKTQPGFMWQDGIIPGNGLGSAENERVLSLVGSPNQSDWFLLANPYDVSIPWSSAYVTAGTLTAGPYSFRGGYQPVSNGGTIRMFEGFWVKLRLDATGKATINIPRPK